METDKEKNSEPTPENIRKASKGYNAKDRDFLGTANDIDDVSKSEKEAMEDDALNERKKRLEEASTTPNKNRIG